MPKSFRSEAHQMRAEDCSGMFMMEEGCSEEDYGDAKHP